MKKHISVYPMTMREVGFVTDIKTDPSLWHYEYDISTDKKTARDAVIMRMDSAWYRQYVVQLNDDEKTLVGFLHLHHYVEDRKSWELGYCILPAFQRRGYGLEGAKHVLREAFVRYNAHKVVAMCNAHNAASRRVLEKLGMRIEGVFREELPWNGGWADQLFFSILEGEYHSMYPSK